MADTKETKEELCHVSICVVENGYKISCNYEDDANKLGVRAGWYPPSMSSKDYVEKTKAAVIERLKKVL